MAKLELTKIEQKLYRLFLTQLVELDPGAIPHIIHRSYPDGAGKDALQRDAFRSRAAGVMGDICRERIALARRYELAAEIGLEIKE